MLPSLAFDRSRAARGDTALLRSSARSSNQSSPAIGETGTKAERFDCIQLTVDAGAKPWLLLDGEPLRFQGPIEFRFLPKAIKTFAFAPERVGANDNDLEFSRSALRAPAPKRAKSVEPPAPLPRSLWRKKLKRPQERRRNDKG